MAHQFSGGSRTNMEGLSKPQSRTARPVTKHHAGQQSVSTNFGRKPTVHVVPAKRHNAATNNALTQAGRAVPLKQPAPGQLVAAGIITSQ